MLIKTFWKLDLGKGDTCFDITLIYDKKENEEKDNRGFLTKLWKKCAEQSTLEMTFKHCVGSRKRWVCSRCTDFIDQALFFMLSFVTTNCFYEWNSDSLILNQNRQIYRFFEYKLHNSFLTKEIVPNSYCFLYKSRQHCIRHC